MRDSRHIYIPGQPVGKGRPRFVKATGHTYTPTKTKDYESLVKRAYIIDNGHTMLTGPIRLDIFAVYQLPKDKKRRAILAQRPYTGKPDIDNVAKVIQDALNGLAYEDDKQVVEMYVEKRYCGEDEEPHVSVTVREI